MSRWCSLGNVGDGSPIDYGGGYIVVLASRGVAQPGAEPHLEYFYGLDGYRPRDYSDYWDERRNDFKRSLPIEVYSVGLERDGAAFIREYQDSWINWENIERNFGGERIPWDRMDDVAVRAWTIYEAASHYGWGEFDPYPMRMTLGELRTRWEKRLRDCRPPRVRPEQKTLFGNHKRLWL